MIQSTTTAVSGPDMALRPDCTALAVPVEKMEAYWVAKPEKVSTFISRPLWVARRGDIDPPCAGFRLYGHCCSTGTMARRRHGISARRPSACPDVQRDIAVSGWS